MLDLTKFSYLKFTGLGSAVCVDFLIGSEGPRIVFLKQ